MHGCSYQSWALRVGQTRLALAALESDERGGVGWSGVGTGAVAINTLVASELELNLVFRVPQKATYWFGASSSHRPEPIRERKFAHIGSLSLDQQVMQGRHQVLLRYVGVTRRRLRTEVGNHAFSERQ